MWGKKELRRHLEIISNKILSEVVDKHGIDTAKMPTKSFYRDTLIWDYFVVVLIVCGPDFSTDSKFVVLAQICVKQITNLFISMTVVYVQRWDPWYSYREKIQKIL